LNGTAYEDECGTCITSDGDEQPCEQDCNNDWGGSAYVDYCGDCVAGNTDLTDCGVDCAGTFNGNSILDDCGDCRTGIDDIDFNSSCSDCAGTPYGDAVEDECGVCNGPGLSTYYLDQDADGFGCETDFIQACEQPIGYTNSVQFDLECGCFNENYGDLDIDFCGICGGDGETCPPGDINNDDVLNVLDISLLIGQILGYHSFDDDWEYDIADMNNNGSLSVVDIVMMVDVILGNISREDIGEMTLIKDSYTFSQSEIFEGIAYDLVINHDDENIVFNISENVMISDYNTEGTSTRMIIVNPQDNLLFTSDQPYTIENIQAAYKGNYINTTFIEIPDKFIFNTYPNPFNPTLNLSFGLPQDNFIDIKVYDIQGRLVDHLLSTEFSAGSHNIKWHAEAVPSGIYFVNIYGENINKTQKVILSK